MLKMQLILPELDNSRTLIIVRNDYSEPEEKPLPIVEVQRLSENISSGKRMNGSRTEKINLYMSNS